MGTFAQKSVALRTLPFSPARKAGPTLYISGQVPRTANGQDVRRCRQEGRDFTLRSRPGNTISLTALKVRGILEMSGSAATSTC